MKATMRVLAACLAMGLITASAMADGMVVPVRPEHRVRGTWAVKYHHVDISVRDQVASVSVDQEFVNTGGGMIEVEYMFPVPPDAAVDSMTLVVNGKEYAAQLLKADEARKIYEEIVRSKKDPALLEYVGYGMYKTSAFPLEPGKPCKVLVTYKSVCKKDGETVEVWYPLNTEKYSAAPIESVKVTVDIKTKADVTAVYSPSHDLKVDRKDSRHVVATYEEKKALPAADFLVYYKAANEDVVATLLTHQPRADEDGYFLMLASPNPGSSLAKVVAKDVVLVLDHSGSMSGEKITQVKEAASHILKNLNKDDRFNIIAYNDSVDPFFEGLMSANKENIASAADMLDRLTARGATNIHEALQKAMGCWAGVDAPGKASPVAGNPKYVIFLTDGLPTVGNRDEGEIIRDAHKANHCDARVFAFGVGYDVNVRLLDRLAEDNSGRSDYVKPNEPVEQKVSSLYSKIKNPIMTNLKIEIKDLKVSMVYPRVVKDLFEGDQIVLVGRYDQKDAAKLPTHGSAHQAQLIISGLYAGKEKAFEYSVTIGAPGGRSGYDFVEKLWATRRVGYLLDEIQLHGQSHEVIDEVIRLSRDYGIITPYTSFLADERVSKADHKQLKEQMATVAEGLNKDDAAVGREGQMNAMNRRELNLAARPAPASAPSQSGAMAGWSKGEDYEAGRSEQVAGMRQTQDQPLYRQQGNVWATAEAGKLDPVKDADKIKQVKRFSDEYFELVRRNTAPENRAMATQQEGEKLLITLRGQAYEIE